MHTDRDRTADRGFTLVELMTVILIMGVLAAIAIPTLMNQRDKGYNATMNSDLHAVVLAQKAWTVDNPAPTTDPSVLAEEGYKQSAGVSLPHIKVTGDDFTACVRHARASHWLVYDSATGQVTTSDDDCV